MSWVKLDDQLPDHPKLARLGVDGPVAGWLYIAGLCYCSRHLTDGFIPESTVQRLMLLPPRGKVAPLVAALVSVGLWDAVKDGYQVHDYLAYNPSRESVEAKRAAWVARQRVSRGESRSDTPVTPVLVTPAVRVESSSPVPRSPSRGASHEAHSAHDGLPNLTDEAIAVLVGHTGQSWSQAGDKQLGEFDRLIGSHGLHAVDRAFGSIRNGTHMTARQLVWAAVKVLEPIPSGKQLAAVDAEDREAARSRRAVQVTKKRAHDIGYHADEPDPMCDACRAVA